MRRRHRTTDHSPRAASTPCGALCETEKWVRGPSIEDLSRSPLCAALLKARGPVSLHRSHNHQYDSAPPPPHTQARQYRLKSSPSPPPLTFSKQCQQLHRFQTRIEPGVTHKPMGIILMTANEQTISIRTPPCGDFSKQNGPLTKTSLPSLKKIPQFIEIGLSEI